MRNRFISGVLTGAALFVWAAAPAAAQRAGVTVTTVANLPAACTEGQPFVVTDGNSASDCVTGSGSTKVLCTCDAGGASYTATGDGTAAVGADSIGTSELNDGADAPSTSQIVAVDSAASTQFEYLALGLPLTNDGDNLTVYYAGTLAADPGLNVDECMFVATAGGGGLLCEGSAADTNEMLFLIPDLNEADTTHVFVTDIATQTLTNKTLTTPTIGDFSNAAHDHSNAAGGGDVALGTASTVTTAAQGDNDTSPASTAFVMNEIRGAWSWDMFSVYPDGTQCGPAIGATINAGPIVGTIECADNAASAIYGDTLDELYDGGTLIFTVQAINENATPSGILDFDFSCQCRGDSDAVNATWGTAANASITFDTQYDLEHGDTAAVTCNGTCAAGDTVFWRAVMDATATTTQVADTKVVGISAREQ